MVKNLKGVNVVITGVFVGYTRTQLKRYLEVNLGANVQSGVTSTTGALIVGEKPGKTKLAAAAHRKVPILTEDDIAIPTLKRVDQNAPAKPRSIPTNYGTF